MIALPAITVILNQAGVLMNGSLPQDGGHCFYSPPSSVIYFQVSRPHLCFHRQGQQEACILMNHLQLLPSSREFRRAAVVLLSDYHQAFSETLWASLTWTYECLIVVYIYRLLSHDQFTAMCPLIWDNVVDESAQEYFIGNACHGIAAIERCVIVSDAWVGYIPN